MIHPQRLARILIVILVLCSAYAQAQTPAQTSEANKELREKAFTLLESAAGQVNTLQSAENRARIAANIMDSLWTHDEKRARSLLAMIESDIKEGLNREDPERRINSHTFQVFYHLRSNTVERIGKYDPELALLFLKSTEVSGPPHLLNHLSARECELELRHAKKIAANKPEIALKIARESLARGLSEDVLVVLRQLGRKHKDEARSLYKEIVSKVRDLNLHENPDNKNFVHTLALSYTPPQADAETFQDLLSFLLTKAVDAGCRKHEIVAGYTANFCTWVMSSLPPSYKADPRVAALKHWASEEHSAAPGYMELNMVARDGSVEEVLALTQKYPGLESHITYRAFEVAKESGDLAKARELANSSTSPELRQLMLEHLDGSQQAKTSNQELLADLQRRLNEQPQPEDRLRILVSFADTIGATDRNTALKLLNQASDLADSLQPGWSQAGAQVGVAMMYCQLKSDRCFQIMEPLVQKLNQLVDAALKLDGFDTEYLRDGEWNMSANGRLGELLTGLAEYAGFFAWCDFDRAVSLSNQFERTEIRLMAQVKLAQSVLAGPPPSLFARYRP